MHLTPTSAPVQIHLFSFTPHYTLTFPTCHPSQHQDHIPTYHPNSASNPHLSSPPVTLRALTHLTSSTCHPQDPHSPQLPPLSPSGPSLTSTPSPVTLRTLTHLTSLPCHPQGPRSPHLPAMSPALHTIPSPFLYLSSLTSPPSPVTSRPQHNTFTPLLPPVPHPHTTPTYLTVVTRRTRNAVSLSCAGLVVAMCTYCTFGLYGCITVETCGGTANVHRYGTIHGIMHNKQCKHVHG